MIRNGSVAHIIFLFSFCLFMLLPEIGAECRAAESPTKAEEAALESIRQSVGAKKYYRGGGFSSDPVHLGINGPSIYIKLYRSQNVSKLKEMLPKSESKSDPWYDTSYRGYPARAYKGYMTEQEVYTLKVKTAHGNGGVKLVCPPYFLAVSVTISEVKTLEDNYNKACSLMDGMIDALKRAGLLQGQQETTGAFNLSLKAVDGLGSTLAGCRITCVIRDPKGKEIRFKTDAFGEGKTPVPIPDAKGDAVIHIDSLIISGESSYGSVPSAIRSEITIDVGKKFILEEKKGFAGRYNLTLPIRALYITAYRGAISQKIAAAPTVAVYQERLKGRIISMLKPAAFDPVTGKTMIYLPAAEKIGFSKLVVFGREKTGQGEAVLGWEETTVAGESQTSSAVILELVPDNIEQQFAKYRPKLKEFLENSGFSKDEVRRIMGFRFTTSKNPGFRYLMNQVIEVNASATLHEASEDACHEIGHMIMDNIGPDNPEGVGGTHEGGATNPNHAWDEGRAHFWAYLLTRKLSLPSAKVTEADHKNRKNCASDQNFVQKSLVEHYGNKSLYASEEDALKDFRAVNSLAIKNLGHPPRNMAEFIQTKRSMPGISGKRLQDINRINQEYAFIPQP